MKTPKYTDGRYSHGYTLAAATDIKRTFNRVRLERERKQQKPHEVVTSIKRSKS